MNASEKKAVEYIQAELKAARQHVVVLERRVYELEHKVNVAKRFVDVMKELQDELQ